MNRVLLTTLSVLALTIVSFSPTLALVSADQCVTVAYQDPTKADPDDLIVRQAKWEDIADLADTLEVVRWEIRYVTNNGQEGRTGFQGRDTWSLRFLRSAGPLKKGIAIGEFRNSPPFGRQQLWRERLGAGQDATIDIQNARVGLEAQIVSGGQVRFDSVDTGPGFTALADRAKVVLDGVTCAVG